MLVRGGGGGGGDIRNLRKFLYSLYTPRSKIVERRLTLALTNVNTEMLFILVKKPE